MTIRAKGLSSLREMQIKVVPYSAKKAAEAKAKKNEEGAKRKAAKAGEDRATKAEKAGNKLLAKTERSTLLPTRIIKPYSEEGKSQTVRDMEEQQRTRTSPGVAQPKLNANGSVTLTKFNHQTSCGDCLHFKGSRHPELAAPCSLLGISTKALAPSCYTPDVTAMRALGPSAFQTLALLVAAMTPKQTRVFMGMLKYAGALERMGYTFLEEVYFTVSDEYLESYYKGFVIGVGKMNELIIVGTDYLQASKTTTIAYLSKDSVLNAEKFKKYARKCIEEGKFHKPQTKKAVISQTHVVPTMDSAPTGEKGVKKQKAAGKANPKSFVIET